MRNDVKSLRSVLTKMMMALCFVFVLCGAAKIDSYAAVKNDREIKMIYGETYTIVPDQTVVSWSSSNEGIATIDANGTISAIVVSTSGITVTGTYEDGSTVTYTVKVLEPIIDETTWSLRQKDYKYFYYNETGHSNVSAWIADTSIATITTTSYGIKVTGVAPGTTTLYVKTDVGEVACQINVGSVFYFDKESYTMDMEDELKVTLPSGFSSYVWSVKNPSILGLELVSSTKQNQRYIVPKAPGTTQVSVTNEHGQVAVITVEVYKEADKIVVSKDDIVLYAGAQYKIPYTVQPSNARVQMEFLATNTSYSKYFTISETGIITAHKKGSNGWVTMIDRLSGFSANIDVKVLLPVLNETSITLSKGEGKQLVLTGSLTPTWTSSNPAVAVVDGNGYVTAVGAGTANITANHGGYEVSATVIVNNPALSYTSVELFVKEYATLSVSNGVGAITWSSANPKIAKVDANGKVTAVKSGNTTITANVAGMNLTCSIKVKPPAFEVKSKKLVVKQKFTLHIMGGTGKVKWSSSNKKVVKVSSKGVVTAVKKGTATIKAKVNGKTLKCKIKVVNNEIKYSVNKDAENYRYGEPHCRVSKAYYSGSKLKLDVWVMNTRHFSAKKFNRLTFTVRDMKGKVIAQKKFTNIKLNLKPWASKKITLTFSGKALKKKNAVLVDGIDYNYTYYYTYTY